MKRRILSTLLALCMTLALLPGTTLAATYSGTTGEVNWSADTATGEFVVSGSGAMGNAPYNMTSFREWQHLKDDMSSITVKQGVTVIGGIAFAYFNNVTSVSLPGSLLTIRDRAFHGCASLSAITIPNSVRSIESSAFRECTRLKNVSLPSSLTILKSGAFSECSSLTEIEIPSKIAIIEEDVFSYCNKLASVTIPASVTDIDRNAFQKDTVLTDVYYAGSKAQWENIDIDSDGNSYLLSAKIHYNSNGPANDCTVIFDANGGKVSIGEKSYTANATLGTLPNPTRTGYKFSGWYTAETGGKKVTASTKVTADMTLYARWVANPKTYTITLNANGGKVSPSSLKVQSGQTYFDGLPTPTRSGFKFDGWYTTKTGSTKVTSSTKATANRTIYAHWTRSAGSRTHLVTFDANGGTVYQDRKIVFSGIPYRDLPTPTKNNSHFQGWYTKKTGGTKVTAASRVDVADDQTLYARWQSSATVRSTQRGTYRVTIPAYYDLALYASGNTARISRQVETTAYQTITCTQKATLSNGTVRYYGKVDGKTGWFTYSCEMDVK